MSIAILFGGRSCEHNVSIVTGVQLLNAVSHMNPLPIYIAEDGSWQTSKDMFDLSAFKGKREFKRVYPRPSSRNLYTAHGLKVAQIDAAVICCHGNGGEDGSLQGLLEHCGIPYTGCDVLTSALCLDKPRLKDMLQRYGIKSVPYFSFGREEWNGDVYSVAERLNAIDFPVIVKPSRLGSSIGVGVACNEAQFVEAVKVAMSFDNTVIVEKYLSSFIELNCAVLGEGKNVIVSEVEQPIGWKTILTYADKYQGSKSFARRYLPAKVPTEVSSEIKSLSIKAFTSLGLAGVVRIDFMYSENDIYLNEINTIPGSLASYLFRYSGISESELVTRLLDVAIKRYEDIASLTFSYKPPALKGKE